MRLVFNESSSDRSRFESHRWQFSLRRMLAVTFGIALLLVFCRWSEWTAGATSVVCALLAATVFLRPATRKNLLFILICAYLPFTWSLWNDFPGGRYWKGDTFVEAWQESAIAVWPIFPALIPLHAIRGHGDNKLLTEAVATLAFLAIATTISTRGRWPLVATLIVVSLLTIFNALFTGIVLHAG